ncbi:MAG: hypothetical protein V3U98_08295 [Acidobacteriota bacterium]
MRHASLWLVACLVVAWIGCASTQTQGLQPTSRTLGPFVYFEEGSTVLITVGTQATRERGEEPFFPLEIGIANKQHREKLIVTREMFSVQVADGEEIPAASAAEVIQGYRPLNADRLLFRSREFTSMYYDRYRRAPSRFYPNSQRRAGLVLETVELNSGIFFEDVLYFRNPGFSLRGHLLRLVVRLKAGEDPIVVVFRVD